MLWILMRKFQGLEIGYLSTKKRSLRYVRSLRKRKYYGCRVRRPHFTKKSGSCRKRCGQKKAIAGKAHVFVWDVQAIKLAPANKSGVLYYKTKLKNHNFSIYNLRDTDCMCNWWHEGEGGMDSPMFVTCAIDYFLEMPIIIWSDGYQNRNQILSNAVLDYAVRYKKTVQQKFLIKGHTQMEVDNVRALIEKKTEEPEHRSSFRLFDSHQRVSFGSTFESKNFTSWRLLQLQRSTTVSLQQHSSGQRCWR